MHARNSHSLKPSTPRSKVLSNIFLESFFHNVPLRTQGMHTLLQPVPPHPEAPLPVAHRQVWGIGASSRTFLV